MSLCDSVGQNGVTKTQGPPSERAAASVLSGLRTSHVHVIPDGGMRRITGPLLVEIGCLSGPFAQRAVNVWTGLWSSPAL